MILVEGAVCAAMKRDVKAGGYLAFGLALEDERWLGLKGNGWIVLAEMGNVPRKVLGTLVEHAGGIPAPGQSWTMLKPRKGDIQRQDTMFGMIEEEIRGLLDGDWSNARQLGRMPLTLDGMGLWQDRQDLSIRRVAPELEDLAEWNGKAYGSGAYLVKSGLFSWCFVLRQPESGGHDVWLRHSVAPAGSDKHCHCEAVRPWQSPGTAYRIARSPRRFPWSLRSLGMTDPLGLGDGT